MQRDQGHPNEACAVCGGHLGIDTLGPSVVIHLGAEGMNERVLRVVCQECCNLILDDYAATFGTVETEG